MTKFVEGGKHVVNVAMITHIDKFDLGGIKVWFPGGGEVRLDPPVRIREG